MLPWNVLLVFFSAYFFLAAYTSGVSVPAGLIVPHMLIGGSMGRAFGLLGIAQKKAMCTELYDLEQAAAYDTTHLSSLQFNSTDGHQRRLAAESGDPTAWMFESTYYWSTVYRWVGRDCRCDRHIGGCGPSLYPAA
jgi:hypothetical protein